MQENKTVMKKLQKNIVTIFAIPVCVCVCVCVFIRRLHAQRGI